MLNVFLYLLAICTYCFKTCLFRSKSDIEAVRETPTGLGLRLGILVPATGGKHWTDIKLLWAWRLRIFPVHGHHVVGRSQVSLDWKRGLHTAQGTWAGAQKPMVPGKALSPPGGMVWELGFVRLQGVFGMAQMGMSRDLRVYVQVRDNFPLGLSWTRPVYFKGWNM